MIAEGAVEGKLVGDRPVEIGVVGTGTAGDDKIRTTKGKTIDLTETYNNKYAYTFASWLVRAQYSYKGRYMVSASIRGRRFVALRPQHPVGLFPGGLRGMAMSDEELPARCEMGRRPENPRQRGTDR